eukprot:Pgem_evm2s6243
MNIKMTLSVIHKTWFLPIPASILIALNTYCFGMLNDMDEFFSILDLPCGIFEQLKSNRTIEFNDIKQTDLLIPLGIPGMNSGDQ